MARQTFFAKIRDRLGAVQLNVGIMALDAAQAASALLIALAHLQLLRMAKRFYDIALVPPRSSEDGDRVVRRRSSSEVQVGLAGPQDSRVSAKVALFADVVANAHRQSRGIHDGVIDRTCQRRIGAAFADVKFSGPMAPFAADGKKTEGRQLIAVPRPGNRARPSRVARYTKMPSGPCETYELSGFISRREVPSVNLGIVRNGRDKKSIAFQHQIASPHVSRTDGIGNFVSLRVHRLAVHAGSRFRVVHLA